MNDYIDVEYTKIDLPLSPPRIHKNAEENSAAYSQWFVDYYRDVTLKEYYISRNESVLYKKFDGNALVEPVKATIATAQDTANNAYQLAKTASDPDYLVYGQIVISNTNSEAIVTFAEEQPDNNYIIVASVGASSGVGVQFGTFLIRGITNQSKSGFTINIVTEPGVGNTVVYNWILRR